MRKRQRHRERQRDMRETETERDKETERETKRQRHRETETKRQRRERDRDREIQKQRDRERDKETETQRDKDMRDKERQRHERERETEAKRQRQIRKQRDRERDKETETQRHRGRETQRQRGAALLTDGGLAGAVSPVLGLEAGFRPLAAPVAVELALGSASSAAGRGRSEWPGEGGSCSRRLGSPNWARLETAQGVRQNARSFRPDFLRSRRKPARAEAGRRAENPCGARPLATGHGPARRVRRSGRRPETSAWGDWGAVAALLRTRACGHTGNSSEDTEGTRARGHTGNACVRGTEGRLA